MAQLITIDNFPRFNLLQVGELTADVASGVTTLPISTDTGFDITHAILIGSPGDETSEIAIPSVASDDSLTVPAIDNAHPKGTKVYKLRGHKVRIYRADKVNGACPTIEASYILQATVSIVADSTETEWNDSTGNSDNHCWLYTFYNDIPATPEETNLDSSEAYSAGDYVVTVDEVKQEAGFTNNRYITESRVLEKIRMAQSEANSSAVLGGYTLPITDSTGVFKNAVLLLAAGYLMTSDYGMGHAGVNKEGEATLKRGKDLLLQIEKGDLVIVGSTATGNSAVSGYPTASDEPSDPYFTRDMKF